MPLVVAKHRHSSLEGVPATGDQSNLTSQRRPHFPSTKMDYAAILARPPTTVTVAKPKARSQPVLQSKLHKVNDSTDFRSQGSIPTKPKQHNNPPVQQHSSRQSQQGREHTGRKRPHELESEEEGSSSEDSEAALMLAERRSTGRRGRTKAVPGIHKRTVRLAKEGIGGVVLYENIHTAVCAELVKTRFVPSQRAFPHLLLGKSLQSGRWKS
jgi:hypothetical protein